MAWQIYTAIFLLCISVVNADHTLDCLTNGTMLVTNPNPELYKNFHINAFRRKDNGKCTGEFILNTTHVELTNCLPGVAVEVVFTRDRSGLLIRGNHAPVMVQCLDIPFFENVVPIAFKGHGHSDSETETAAPKQESPTESPFKVSKDQQDDYKVATKPVKEEQSTTKESPTESPLINLLVSTTKKLDISVTTAAPNKD